MVEKADVMVEVRGIALRKAIALLNVCLANISLKFFFLLKKRESGMPISSLHTELNWRIGVFIGPSN